MMDATTIHPGQRYAWRGSISAPWEVGHLPTDYIDGMEVECHHPIVEPDALHTIPVGATVLNVATGAVKVVDAATRWWIAGLTNDDLDAPLLALVAGPEDDA